MSLGSAIGTAWDLAFRMFPHATRPGLRRIGDPGPQDPVLLTGNYTETVRRLRRVLAGRNVWLLLANSDGINVWCAATGGHLTDHDVIGVLRSSRIGDEVEHRRLVLPQLAATGIEPRRIEAATGWKGRWGPARLEDLPDYLDRGCRVRKSQRFMRFPLDDRLEMASIWALPLGALVLVGLGLAIGWAFAGVVTATLILAVVTLFLLVPRIPVKGRWRWATFAAAAAAGTAVGTLGAWLVGAWGGLEVGIVAGTCTVTMGILSVDFAGTTPWYASTINSARTPVSLELVEERCTGAAQCVLVCPRNVLKMDGRRRKVTIARPDDCVRCGACIVQCPDDALRFRFDDGRVVPPAQVRRTRLNLMGRRTVEVPRD
jgi:NAD-dependent dihydropyrimidine dehydrogenase PreA subunit